MNIDFNVGEVVPGTHYRVVLRIGQGGMGSVYEVEHVELGKRFVLKALLPQFLERKDLVQRLRNEWRSLGKLEHANIVSVSDAGVAKNGVPFYVMERLQGETLAAALKARGRLSIGEAVRIACEILEGLSAAHEIGVVHRDVKPPNIFLTQGGVAKVLDFGIAKLTDGASLELTGRGIAIGTPRYMSPEQAAGEPVDGRADVYAVGLLLFEMIAGVGPFDGGDANEVFLAHLTRVPPRLASVAPGVTAELDGLTAALLAKHPCERPATAGAAARALRGILRGYPQLRQDTFQSPMVGALTPVMPQQAVVEARQEPPRVLRSMGPATIFPPAPHRVGSQPSARLGQRVLLADVGSRRTPAPLAGYPADLTTQALAGGVGHSAPPPSLNQLAATFNDAPPTRTAVPMGSSPPPSSISRPPAWGSPSLPAPAAAPPRTRLVALSALAAGVLVAGVYWLGRSPARETVALPPEGTRGVLVAAVAPVAAAAPIAAHEAVGIVLPEAAGIGAIADRSSGGVGASVGRSPRASTLKARTSSGERGSGASSGSFAAHEGRAHEPGAERSGAAVFEGVAEHSASRGDRGDTVESPVGADEASKPQPNRVSSPSRGIENAGRRLPGPGIPLYRMQPRGR